MYELVDGGRGADLRPLERGVGEGTSLLITGPALAPTERLAYAVLATGHDAGEGTSVVSTEASEAAVRTTFDELAEDVDESRFGLVDCTGRVSGEGPSGPGRVQHVSSPNDLTGIGIGITRTMEALSVRRPRYRLGFDSLTTLLAYREPSDVFKFCHLLTSRLTETGSLSVLTLDTDAHDDQTVNMIVRAFDGVIDIRRAPSDADHDRPHELRLRGFDAQVEWEPVTLP